MSKVPNYQPILTLSLKSITNIPACRFVESDGRLCRFGSKSIGVSEIDSQSGEIIPIIALGTCLVKANANISVGMDICSDANGLAVPYESGSLVNGVALSSGIAGEFVKILLRQ